MQIQIVQCPPCKAYLKIKVTNPDSAISCPNCSYRDHLSRFLPVPLKRVQCKGCNSVLSVIPDTQKTVVCPKCNRENNISGHPAPKMYNKVQSPDQQLTQMPTQMLNRKKILNPGLLQLQEGNCNTLTVSLNRGINVIGKKSASSSSTIQLDSSDEYMSRRHIIIDVVMNSDSSLEHHLSDAGSKNGTFHNGERIASGDIIILSGGDIIKIGKCIFRFVLE